MSIWVKYLYQKFSCREESPLAKHRMVSLDERVPPMNSLRASALSRRPAHGAESLGFLSRRTSIRTWEHGVQVRNLRGTWKAPTINTRSLSFFLVQRMGRSSQSIFIPSSLKEMLLPTARKIIPTWQISPHRFLQAFIKPSSKDITRLKYDPYQIQWKRGY